MRFAHKFVACRSRVAVPANQQRFVSRQSVAGGKSDPNTYCQNLVRNHDYESWLCSYFFPAHAKSSFFALKAFFVELAQIPDSVSNAAIGQMRLKFWKDTISSFSEQTKPTPQHPIALSLAQAFQTHDLQPYHLKRIVDARVRAKPLDLEVPIDFSFKIAELDNPTHMRMETLTNHIESTYSTLLYLLLQTTSKSSSSEIHHVASHLGLAHGLMTLLRALPFHAANRRLVIPAEITSKHGVNQEEVFRYGSDAKGISDAVFDFATHANDNLLVARDMFGKLGLDQQRAALPVFLIGAPIQSFLTRLEAINFNAFEPSLQQRYWKLPWQIWRAQRNTSF